MGEVAVKVKIMPTSLDVNLNELKTKIKNKIEEIGGRINKVEQEPIAFGLNAIIITFAWPEEKNTSIIEDNLNNLENINSVQIVDYRRAIG